MTYYYSLLHALFYKLFLVASLFIMLNKLAIKNVFIIILFGNLFGDDHQTVRSKSLFMPTDYILKSLASVTKNTYYL